MRSKFTAFLFSFLFVCGCASVGVRDNNLNLRIEPLPVIRGKPALAQIDAPMDAEKVIGTVKVFGSPQLIFDKIEEKGIWYFYGTIPFSPWVKPGTYQVQVLVYMPHEMVPHYTELKVDLK